VRRLGNRGARTLPGVATDGLVVVDKPAGCTSHDVVGRLRRIYGQRRIGHAGTLDPDATGVLVVALGRATRLLRFVQDSGKTYEGVVAFGVATDTLDAAGAVLERRALPVSREDVERAMRRFHGTIEQVPPMVSAIKIGGRKLYELAREGQEIDRPARAVRIDRFDLLDFEPGSFPRATVVVECGTGTYIRSLAADLGAALGGPAHLASLRRTRVSSFGIEEAATLEQIEADPLDAVLPPIAATRELVTVPVDESLVDGVGHGAVFPAPVIGVADELPGPFALVGPDGSLLAVYERRGRALKPAVVMVAGRTGGKGAGGDGAD
jgi:tRNA pseudouridine55 synthase